MPQTAFIPDTSPSIPGACGPCSYVPEISRMLTSGRRPRLPEKFSDIPFQHIMRQRMDIFGLTPETLAEKAFVDLSTINGLLDGSIQKQDIDETELERIGSALSTCVEVLSGDAEDFVSNPSRHDTAASLQAKARLQQMLDDTAFVQSVMDERTR